MTNIERFIDYAMAFEQVLATDDWNSLERFFTEDAVHHAKGGGPLAVLSMGRDDVIVGLHRSVAHLDRRFDRRLPEVLTGPEERDGAVWITWRLTLERAGLPSLVVEGSHATSFRGDRICRIDEGLSRATGERVATYLREHGARLRPVRTSAGDTEHASTGLSIERMRALIVDYAAAKSRADTDGALANCHDSFFIETVPFGIASRDKVETAAHLHAFFAAFPDYGVRVGENDLLVGRDTAACWGTATLSFKGDFGPIAATGARAEIPIFCVFTFRDGLLAGERFFFDLATLCQGIEVPVTRMQETLALLRGESAAAA